MISEKLDVFWPEVEARLYADLRARRVAPETAADSCQEVAERVLIHEVAFDDAGDLLRWARVVGRRLAIDHYRKQARLLVGDVPESAASHGPEEIVAGRLDVEIIGAAMRALSERDRSSLLEPDTGATRKERMQTAVRRHRVRQRLLASIEALAAWVFGVRPARRVLRAGVIAAAIVVPVVLTMVALPSTSHRHPHAVTPTAHVPATASATVAPHATSRSTSAPTTTPPTTSAPPQRSVLAPLQGRSIDPPGPNGPFYTRERADSEAVLCLNDYPVIGTICTPF